MIFDQDLPKYIWGEATMISVYIQNISPHIILDNMTLEEDFIGKKPCVKKPLNLWVSRIHPCYEIQAKEVGLYKHKMNLRWL